MYLHTKVLAAPLAADQKSLYIVRRSGSCPSLTSTQIAAITNGHNLINPQGLILAFSPEYPNVAPGVCATSLTPTDRTTFNRVMTTVAQKLSALFNTTVTFHNVTDPPTASPNPSKTIYFEFRPHDPGNPTGLVYENRIFLSKDLDPQRLEYAAIDNFLKLVAGSPIPDAASQPCDFHALSCNAQALAQAAGNAHPQLDVPPLAPFFDNHCDPQSTFNMTDPCPGQPPRTTTLAPASPPPAPSSQNPPPPSPPGTQPGSSTAAASTVAPTDPTTTPNNGTRTTAQSGSSSSKASSEPDTEILQVAKTVTGSTIGQFLEGLGLGRFPNDPKKVIIAAALTEAIITSILVSPIAATPHMVYTLVRLLTYLESVQKNILDPVMTEENREKTAKWVFNPITVAIISNTLGLVKFTEASAVYKYTLGYAFPVLSNIAGRFLGSKWLGSSKSAIDQKTMLPLTNRQSPAQLENEELRRRLDILERALSQLGPLPAGAQSILTTAPQQQSLAQQLALKEAVFTEAKNHIYSEISDLEPGAYLEPRALLEQLYEIPTPLSGNPYAVNAASSAALTNSLRELPGNASGYAYAHQGTETDPHYDNPRQNGAESPTLSLNEEGGFDHFYDARTVPRTGSYLNVDPHQMVV